MPSNNIELRNVDVTQKDYLEFMSMHEKVSYSDVDDKEEVFREPHIHSYEEYQAFIAESNIVFIVCEDEVKGYIIFDVWDEKPITVAKIQEMVIKKEYRRSGYGKRAIKQLFTELSENDIDVVRVFSATIATDNFYSSCNFRYKSGDIYEYRLN